MSSGQTVETAAGGGPTGILGFAATSTSRARDCYAGIAEFSVYVRRSARGRGVGLVPARARRFAQIAGRLSGRG